MALVSLSSLWISSFKNEGVSSSSSSSLLLLSVSSLSSSWRSWFQLCPGCSCTMEGVWFVAVLLLLRGIPHEGPNPSFEPKSKFLWNHQDSKFLRNSQKLLRFQVLRFTDFNIRKRGHGISKFLFFMKSKFLQTKIFTKIPSYTASFNCFQCTTCILER